MIFSYKELKRLANLTPKTTLEEVNKAINTIGFEVDGTTSFGNVEGVKFGKILEITKNPNADNLHVCKIEFSDKTRVIQTNSNTVSVGMVVVAFVPGSKKGDITFAAKELKGINSEGMLTSLGELGVPKDLIRPSISEGITPYSIKDLSLDPVEVLGLQDTLIDVDILSNRSDAQSYLIMAKELAAYFGTKPLALKVKTTTKKSTLKVTKGIEKSLVLVEGTKDFTIDVAKQILLAKGGVKSINDIVDLSNLTLIMTGQPTHAYDASKVGKDFSVSLAKGKVVVFGNKEVELKDDLVVKSANKIVSLGGVIGLEETGSSEDTKDFVLEMGRFNIKDVRKSAKTIKMSTTSSIQSSKEIALGTTALAIEYISTILKDFSLPVNKPKEEVVEVEYNFEDTKRLAGFDITKEKNWNKTIKSLESLGYSFTANKVTVPSYRHDIKTKQDINEEVFRFFGYDSFEPVKPMLNPTSVKHVNDIKSSIAAQGYQEVVTYSLISKVKNNINPFGFKDVVNLETFVSKEREVIRSSQAYSLLEVVEYNKKRKLESISLFSQGMIGDGVESIIMATSVNCFHKIKKDVLNLLPSGITFKRYEGKELHEGVSALIFAGSELIGWIGKVSPMLTEQDVYMAEFIKWDGQALKEIKKYSSEPLKARDVTYELKEKEDIASHIEKTNAHEVKVIDTYEKDGVKKVTLRYIEDKE